MNELNWFVWLFPFLFIVHDMEEIIMAKHWCKKDFKQHIHLPITPFGNTKSTAGLAIGVYEELLILMIAAAIGNISGFYGLWYGLLVGNIVHLILFHIILLPLSYHCYIPGEITAWLTVIPCCYILKLAQNILGYTGVEVAVWITVGIVFAFLNMKMLHKNINKLAKLVE